VVSIRNWDLVESSPEEQLLHDFALWREQLRTVDDLGAAIVFVRHFGNSPAVLGSEEIRAYQVYLINDKQHPVNGSYPA
jgi:hypothetical protein